ncbi:MAG: ABC transporter ATP-binding protein [Candidatus Methanomethylophilaceae archaeon]|nr:ABC transporter ATP-binding protein [Candidatus Methanomethylophilaceae archaeon]MBR4697082.1 ABC transporter ATP-binding protein [Candidatus Methanomethylophilaceae archaeon]MBR6871124.1 ABC transporter ATP-binding protein [Candidatus Methanomethylophilaceae archaeon]
MIVRYFTWKEWGFTALCVVFVIFQAYLDLRIPEYMTAITDAIMDNESPSVITGYGAEMMLCSILSIAASLLGTMMAVRAATSLCYLLREKLFDKVSEFTPGDVDRFSVDSLITRSTNDVSQIQQFLTRSMQTLILVPVITAWALMKISGSEWEWTAVTAAGVVITVLSIALVVWKTRPGYKRIPVLTDRINHHALEHLTGLRVVRAYNAERFQERKFEESSDDMMDNSLRIWRVSSITPTLSSSISNFLMLAIYWLGILLLSGTTDHDHQVLLFSDMIVFSAYAVQILNAFMKLGMMIQFSSRAFASIGRVNELLDYDPAIPDGTYDGKGDESGTVEFQNVSFTYPGTDVEVLHDVSFKIERGETVAIMGATGAGKSTLVNLIMRLYKCTEGRVLVNGVDVLEYDRKALNSQISFVPQTNTIFTGTIEFNINYGSTAPERDMDDIHMAESIAQASEFIDNLEGNESFELTEEGRNLSGGQRQRISIARAVCKNAPIWILDDPFSALDFITDSRLRSAIREYREAPTKVFVAQRVGTVMDSDKIIVLDEGRIVGIGSHEELMRDCELYREVAESQLSEVTE